MTEDRDATVAFESLRKAASLTLASAASQLGDASPKSPAGALERFALTAEALRSPLAFYSHCERVVFSLRGMLRQLSTASEKSAFNEAADRLEHYRDEALAFAGCVPLWSEADKQPLDDNIRRLVVEDLETDPNRFTQLSTGAAWSLTALSGALNFRHDGPFSIIGIATIADNDPESSAFLESFCAKEDDVALHLWGSRKSIGLVASWEDMQPAVFALVDSILHYQIFQHYEDRVLSVVDGDGGRIAELETG